MKDNYVAAILELLKEGTDAKSIFAGLQDTLAKRGHQQLYPSILKTVQRILEAQTLATATVAVASEADVKKFKTAIADSLSALNASSSETVIDQTLVGGFIVEANNTRIDNSYKKQLINMYRSLTK